MRAREFFFEGEMSPSISNLIATLENLRSTTDQIRVDSLVNLVRKRPGSEMFNLDILNTAVKENTVVKNLIKRIHDDDFGVKYVYLKGLESSEDDLPQDPIGSSEPGGSRNPQQTVAAMAKRASRKRI